MRIVIVGAAGNVGTRTVDAALAAGHDVVAYVRRPEAVPARPHLTVVRGAAEDSGALADAARGADAVIIAITGTMRDRSFMQRTLPSLISGLRAADADRVILVSVFGAGDTAAKASGFARVVYRTALRSFLADKAAGDRLLEQSGLPWTIAYPVNLKDAPAAADEGVVPMDEVGRVPGLPTLPYANAARALVRIAEDPSSRGAHVLVTTAGGYRAS